jgi:hypothetical protein
MLARRILALAMAAGVACGAAVSQPGPPADPRNAAPEALRAGFERARQAAAADLFDRPLYLRSGETPGQMRGDVYARTELSYAELRQVMVNGASWCGVLMLHLNMQYCRASGPAGRELLDAGIGRKFNQALDELYWLRFGLSVARADDDYLQVALQSPTGPFGTHDYRIEVEAVPVAGAAGGALLHLTYSYGYGSAARWAMQAYLATLGSGKVGFSIVGRQPDGKPIRVGGLRGVLERNTLRYHFAIEAFLAAQSLPPERRQAQRLQDWFSATERYAPQLHEIDREAYLAMKQRQALRQLSQAPPPRSP